MATRIKLRRDTAANWLTQNPILAAGETGFETDTRMVKLGDGSTAWKDLKYAVTGDLQVTGDAIHGDVSVSLSSGVGNSENWILLTDANTGNVDSPTDAYVNGVAYDSQGNVFTMGLYGNPDGGVYLQKISPSGELLWNNYYQEYNSYGFGMAVDRFDNVVMLLSESNSSSDDVILVKVAGDDGSIVWQKYLNSYGDYNDYASCMDTDAEGNIFITGKSNNAGPNSNDAAYVAKFSGSNGSLIWSKQYNVDGLDSTGTGLTTDKDGNIGIVGSANAYGGFLNMFKINGTTGAIMWQGKILNAKFDNGNNTNGLNGDIHFGQIQSSDVTSDTQGNFYLTFNWWHNDYPGVAAMVAKFNGTTGKSEWAQVLTYTDFAQSVGSVICDELNNVYVSSTLIKHKSNYDIGGSYRPTQNITKINSTGSVVWQRWLSKENAVNPDGKDGFFGDSIGQSIRVNKDYVAVVGNSWTTRPYYNDNQDWYVQPYVAQLNRDGTEFEVDGWKFVNSLKDTYTTFASLVNDDNNYVYDPAEVLTFNFTITNGDVGYQQNDDTTELMYVTRSNVNKVTFSEKTLMLPAGGAVELGREKNGYITAIGSFDGVEGGNYHGAVWLNGSARDERGGTYAAGGWYDTTGNNWNNWQNYQRIPMVFKTDADGKLVWQAGNALDQNWSNPDLVDVVYHQDTNTVLALGNDGELDGHEGFNVMYLDADTGSMKQAITHIRPAEGSNDIYPTTLNVMSDGSPLVSGYITSARATYSDVTAGAAGLAGSTNSGTLVVLKEKFTVEGSTSYPKEDGTWYLYPGDYLLQSVNRYGYDDAQPTITQTSTLGSAATVDITIAGAVVTAATINAGGSGYKPGHRLVISGAVLGGVDGTNDVSVFVSTVDGSGAITALDTTYLYGALVDGTYTGVETTAAAGTGLVAWVQYAPEGDTYTTFNINNGGNYYGVGDTFKILGTELGGATPANDLTITVTAINSVGAGNGVITEVSLAGTPQSTNIKLYGGNQDYTVSGTYNVVHELGNDGFIWTPTWSRVFGSAGTNYDDFHGLAVDTSDNVIVSGYSDGTDISGSWYNGGYTQTGIITKFSSTGEILWSKCIDGSEGLSTVWGVDTDAEDNIYSVMSSQSATGHPYITKLSPDGDFIWQQDISLYYSNAWSIATTATGDVLIAGRCWGTWFSNNYRHGNNNILIVKFDKDGNQLFSRILWSTDGIRVDYNDNYSNRLTINGDRFSFVAHSNDPGDQDYQGIVVDLPLDGTGVGDYGDFHYEEVETGYHYRWTQNNANSFNKVTDITSKITTRPYTFVDAPYVDADAWRNISIYGNRGAEIQTIYKPEGAEIKGVAKITFEDGSVQTSSQQGLPQVKTSQVNANGNDYWLRPEDNGKHVLKNWNSAVIIPDPGRVYLPIGYAITIITQGNITGVVCENNYEALVISGGNGSYYSSATIPVWTMATIVKIQGTPGNAGLWMIAGGNITNGY
jgi:hypothetical protein